MNYRSLSDSEAHSAELRESSAVRANDCWSDPTSLEGATRYFGAGTSLSHAHCLLNQGRYVGISECASLSSRRNPPTKHAPSSVFTLLHMFLCRTALSIVLFQDTMQARMPVQCLHHDRSLSRPSFFIQSRAMAFAEKLRPPRHSGHAHLPTARVRNHVYGILGCSQTRDNSQNSR